MSKVDIYIIEGLIQRNIPREPILFGKEYACAACLNNLFSVVNKPNMNDKFCSYCGQKVKWGE